MNELLERCSLLRYNRHIEQSTVDLKLKVNGRKHRIRADPCTFLLNKVNKPMCKFQNRK